MMPPLTYQGLLEGRRPSATDLDAYLRASSKEDQGLLALGFALADEPEAAKALLAHVEARGLESESNPVVLEAQSVLAASLSEAETKVEELAAAAVEARPGSVFGLRILGRIAEHRKQKGAAAGYYKAAWEAFPQSQRTLLDLLRVLIGHGQKAVAGDYLRRARFSVRREIYRLALGRRGLYGLAIAITAALLVLGGETYLPTIVLVNAVGLSMVLYAVRLGDGVALSVGIWLELVIWVMFAVRLLFVQAT